MKNLIAIAVIALMIVLPFASAAMNTIDNKILPVTKGKGEITREQLREKFLGEENFRVELRNRIQECKDSETEECQVVKETVKEVVKGVMNKICNNYNEIVEKLKTRIDKNPRLTADEKDALKDVVDEQANKFEELCERVEGATPEELKEIVQEMKQLMHETKVKFGITKNLVHAKRVGLVLQRAEHLETKLQDFVEKWNVTNCSIENLTADFNAKIAEAREVYNESVDLWKQFHESVQNHEPNTELLKEAQEKKQLAQLKLKEAHLILKEIIIELRECRELSEGKEVEEESEIEKNES